MASRRRLELAALLAAVASLAASGLAAGELDPPAAAPPVLPAPRAVPTPASRPVAPLPWVARLYPLHVENLNTRAEANLVLFRPDGSVDPRVVETFSAVSARGEDDVWPLRTRLVELAFKTAYHFGAGSLVILSAYRPHAGYHSKCAALDFQLPGVNAKKLSAWLRRLPRAGVGVYTHPRTQFVHLDVRRMSYHWLDASPPGVTWKELRLRDPSYRERDASYTPASDLPLVTPRPPEPPHGARR
jgi:hypothetical protein